MNLDGGELRAIERASIRAFLEAHPRLLKRRVLDYGCGAEPYRDVVEAAGGTYEGFDREAFPANVSRADVGPASPLDDRWDAIVCTQVLQYVPDPADLLRSLRAALWGRDGHLLLTYPTTWPQVEAADLYRFTRAGVELLLATAGFDVVWHQSRFAFGPRDFELSLGGAVVARPGIDEIVRPRS